MFLRVFMTIVFYLSLFIFEGYCGDITIAFSPSSIKYGSESTLRASYLDDVLAASLGYTPKSLPWKGLTVTSPFNYPSAAVLISVPSGGATIKQEGASYELKEDALVEEAYHRLTATVGSRAQRPTHFNHINLDEGTSSETDLPKVKWLDPTKDPDAAFLVQLHALSQIPELIKSKSSASHGGQDVIYLEIDSFEPVVNTYGIHSNQVVEAIDILRTELARTVDEIRHVYNDKVIIVTATVEQTDKLIRKTRALLEEDKVEEEVEEKVEVTSTPSVIKDKVEEKVEVTSTPSVMKENEQNDEVSSSPSVKKNKDRPTTPPRQSNNTNDHNLAVEYGEDYPAIFNIVLILSIVLFLALLAVSISLAFMDPGRDSIIYRMTNPRMKKDQ